MADMTDIIAGSAAAIAGGVFIAMKRLAPKKPRTAAEAVEHEIALFSGIVRESIDEGKRHHFEVMDEQKRHNTAIEAEARRNNDALEKMMVGLTQVLANQQAHFGSISKDLGNIQADLREQRRP